MKFLADSSRMTSAALIFAIIGAWVVAAPWLAANQLLSVGTEFTSHWYCLIGSLAALYFAVSRAGPSRKHRIAALSISVLVCLVILVLIGRSNTMFLYWKLKAVPRDAWTRMASELQDLASRKKWEERRISRTEIPASVWILGSREQYRFGEAALDRVGRTAASVSFGAYNMRLWGLYLGDESGLEVYNRGCRYTRVGSNAFFFVGTNH